MSGQYPVTGIPKPEKELTTADQMRKAIFKAQRDDGLIRAAFQVADTEGMSGEDRYVFLAYQALRRMHEFDKQTLLFLNNTPFNPQDPAQR